jgi:uncharacterized membrane protein
MTDLRRVWLIAAAYGVVLFALGADRYATYRAGADLGLFVQSIATVFAGFGNTMERGSHFTYHFSPILYACAPFLLATHSALALTALQAVAGALVPPPLYLIARKRMSASLAFSVAIVAALYPPMVGVTFTDFHENGFAPAATLWLLWALDAGRFRLAATFAAVTLCIKEDQSLLLAFGGIWGAFAYARAKDRARATFCAAVVAGSLATFVAFFTVVRPLAGAIDIWGPTHFYAWSHGPGTRGGIAPWYSIGRPAYVLEALVPLCFVALWSPAFVLAIPGFIEVLGSHESLTYTMGTHYAAVWIPYVLLAFALGIARIAARSPRTAINLMRTSIAICALILAVASPTHWGHYLGPYTAHDAVLDRAVARAGTSLDIGTFDEVYAHLGFDPNARIGILPATRYALADTTYPNAEFTRSVRPILLQEVAAGTARLISSEDGVELYRRGGTPAAHAEGAQDGRGSVVARARPHKRRAIDRSRRNQ